MTNHPSGCIVQLSAGTYESQQLIAESFHGWFQGKGMDVTTIEVLAPLVVTISDENVAANAPSRTNKYPVLLLFTGGDVTVSDITFKVSDPNPTTSWWYGGTGPGQTWLEAPVGVIGSSANLTVQRVACEGGPGMIDGFFNYNNCVLFWGGIPLGGPPLSGKFKFVSSHVKHSSNSFEVYSLANAQLTFGGSPSDGNVFEDSEEGGLMFDADHSVIEYSFNHVTLSSEMAYGGLLMYQGAASILKHPSQFFVHENTFVTTGRYEDGVFLGDFNQSGGQGKSADVWIFNNSISLGSSDSTPSFAGVELYSTVGSAVINNDVSGTPVYGISIESGDKCVLLVNALSQLAGETAAIWLDPGTSDCLVVGNGQPTSVLNQGTNDTLVNVNDPQATQGNTPMFGVPRQMPSRILRTR